MRSRKPPEEDTPEIHGMANLWMHAWRANTSRHTQPHTYRCLCWHNWLTSYQRNHTACFSSPRVPLLFFLTAARCYLRKGLWGTNHAYTTQTPRNPPPCPPHPPSPPRPHCLFFSPAALCYLVRWSAPPPPPPPPSLLLKMFVGASNILRAQKRPWTSVLSSQADQKAQFPLFKVQCAQDCFSSGRKKKRSRLSQKI